MGVSPGVMGAQMEAMMPGGLPNAHSQPSLAPSPTQLLKHTEIREHLAKFVMWKRTVSELIVLFICNILRSSANGSQFGSRSVEEMELAESVACEDPPEDSRTLSTHEQLISGAESEEETHKRLCSESVSLVHREDVLRRLGPSGRYLRAASRS
ncbi:hypothetical protein DNTS_026745 [Danionella cerebrum]|uniref:Uncharacterized protein n=1 Tax=Danionella cerebrum TaxID=2873325 RepID=A0A553RMH6_9TELE|nr:hypothetical protein DNTS_026745 [Danionella translucida]